MTCPICGAFTFSAPDRLVCIHGHTFWKDIVIREPSPEDVEEVCKGIRVDLVREAKNNLDPQLLKDQNLYLFVCSCGRAEMRSKNGKGKITTCAVCREKKNLEGWKERQALGRKKEPETICRECKKPMEQNSAGTRKYHPECAVVVKKRIDREKEREKARAKRCQ